MEQQNSIKSELNTLIMLEQQQTEALHALNNKAGYTPTIGQMQTPMAGSYAPNFGGFQGGGMMAPATAYAQNVQAAQNFAAGYGMPGMDQLRGFSASAKNALVNTNLDSMNPFWANQSKMSNQAIEQASTNLGEKMATGTLSAASVFSGMGGQALGSVLTGGSFIGSLALGGAAGWALGTTVDIMADQMKQNYAYDRYLQQNSYRFINVNESNNTRSPAGFNRDERWQTANYLRHFGSKMKISDDDTMMLLKQYTEGDLLRSVSDTESFKKQMETLTKSVKTMALSLNDSYEEIAKMMAELKKKGINTRDYKALSGEWRITGGITGQDGTDVANFQVGLASSITQGTFANNNSVLGGVNGAQQWLGKLFDDAEKNGDDATYQAIINANSGDQQGAEGATEAVTSAAASLLSDKSGYFQKFGAAFFDYNDKTGQFTFNQQRFDTYAERLKSGDMSINDLSNIATTMYQNHDLYAAWESKSTELLYNSILGDYGNQASMISAIAQAGANMSGKGHWSLEEQLRQIFGIEGNAARLMAMGYEAYDTQGGAGYLSQMRSAAMAQTMLDEYNSNRVGFGYEVKNWWQGVKDTMGDAVAPMAGGFNKLGEAIGDAWYGKQYKDVTQLWSGIDWTVNPYQEFNESLQAAQRVALNTANADMTNALMGTNYDDRYEMNGALARFEQALTKAAEAAEKEAAQRKKSIEWYKNNFTTNTDWSKYEEALNMSGKTYYVANGTEGGRTAAGWTGAAIGGGVALALGAAGLIAAPFTGGLSLAAAGGAIAGLGITAGAGILGYHAGTTAYNFNTNNRVNGANYAANYWNRRLGLGVSGGGIGENGEWIAHNNFETHQIAMGVSNHMSNISEMTDEDWNNLTIGERINLYSDMHKGNSWLADAGYEQHDISAFDASELRNRVGIQPDIAAMLKGEYQPSEMEKYIDTMKESAVNYLLSRTDIAGGIDKQKATKWINSYMETGSGFQIFYEKALGQDNSTVEINAELDKLFPGLKNISSENGEDQIAAFTEMANNGPFTPITEGSYISYNALGDMTPEKIAQTLTDEMDRIQNSEEVKNAMSENEALAREIRGLEFSGREGEIITALSEGRELTDTDLLNIVGANNIEQVKGKIESYRQNQNVIDTAEMQYEAVKDVYVDNQSMVSQRGAREAGFVALATAYGMSNDYIKQIQQGFGKGKTANELAASENTFMDEFQSLAFEGINYSSITESNSEDIISAMTSNLASGGVIKAEEAYSLASQFVTSQLEEHGGSVDLNENTMREWVQLMLGNVSGSESAKTSTYQKDVVSLLTDIRDLTAQKGIINSTNVTDPVSGEQRNFHSPATTGVGRDTAPTENSNGTNIASQNSSSGSYGIPLPGAPFK